MKQHLEIVAMDLCPTELNQSRTKEACDPEKQSTYSQKWSTQKNKQMGQGVGGSIRTETIQLLKSKVVFFRSIVIKEQFLKQ